MTTTNPALLAAVLDDPADDTSRLVYADWLEENGEPERAEFIRVQCELAKLDSGERCYPCGWPYRPDGGCEPGNCSYRPEPSNSDYVGWKERQHHYHDLRRREGELWLDYGKDWIPPVFDFHRGYGHMPYMQTGPIRATVSIDQQPVYVFFRRGFVAELRGSAAVILGGVCERCGSRGWYERDPGDSEMSCYQCSGSGRTPGVLRDLCWWPGATDVCPKCLVTATYGRGRAGCDRCGRKKGSTPGVGRVPRPMPPHAQPVTRVVLATWPDEREIESLRLTGWGQGEDLHRQFWLTRLAAEYGPRVEWVLPGSQA